MKIKQDDLKAILCEYLAAEVLPKIGNNQPLTFFLGFVLEEISDCTVFEFFKKHEASLRILNVIDENKEINVDLLYKVSSEVLKKYCDGSFDVCGYHVNQNDLDSLRLIASEHAC